LSLLSALFVSPVFIGKTQGRKRTGQPLCCRPSTALATCGKLWAVSASS
jgi:hypothetical protein